MLCMDTEIERSENQLLAAATAAGAMMVAGLLVPFRSHLTGTTVALVMMVVVVCAAAVGGRFAGVATAVTATLSYDFLFTRPYQSLKIASADDVEVTILLLLCGLIVGTVAARAERSGSTAARMKGDLLHVHRIAELVAAGAPVAEVVIAAEVQLTDLLGLRNCRFESPSGTEPIALLSRSGAVMARSGVRQGPQV
jgi:K+-sensing histidine kinase KdpD